MELIDGLSESLAIQKSSLSMFDEVDDIVARSITVGDPTLAFDYGRRLIENSMVRGLALAKLLYRMNEGWALYTAGGTDDDLETMAFVQMGVKPQTTKKYIRMWEAIFENPSVDDETKALLRGRPIKDLLLLTAAVREGSLQGEELKEVALGMGSVRDAVRAKRGEQTSSGTALRIQVNMQPIGEYAPGALIAHQGGKSEVCGFLNVESTNELIQKAIAKLVNSGIVEERYGVR